MLVLLLWAGCSGDSTDLPAIQSDSRGIAGAELGVAPGRELGVAPGRDLGVDPRPDAADPYAEICACLALQPRVAVCLPQPATCAKDEECCLAPFSIPCGVYGNKYRCVQGVCKRAGCQSKSECVTYAQTLAQPDAENYFCREPGCSGDEPACAPGETCSIAADCCTSGSGGACGVYPNKWACEQGSCVYQGCLEHSECAAWAQAQGSPSPENFTCQRWPCHEMGSCTARPTPCNTPTDCCVPGAAVPCGTYGNRYRCENGGCVLDSCLDHPDCQSYAQALGLPDPALYSCAEY